MSTTNLTKKVLCVNLRKTCLGTSFVDRTLTAELEQSTGAAKGKVRGSKKILGDSLKPIQGLLREAGNYVKDHTLPGISDDLRLVTPARLEDIRERIGEIDEKISAEVAKFSEIEPFAPRNTDGTQAYPPVSMTRYAALIEQDRLDLKAAFDPHDYPPLENLGHFFTLRLTVCDLPSGDYSRVEGLTEDAIQRMKEDHEKLLATVSAAARNDVHKKLVEMVTRIADNLSKEDISKLHNTTFDNLHEYLEQVPELNITNDPQLEAMRKEALESLNFTMAQVKASAALKEKAAAAAKSILNQFGHSNRKLVFIPPAAPEMEAAA